MIRLSLRQFRTQGWVASGPFLLAAVLLGSTRPHLAQIYDDYAKSHAACAASGRCLQANINISELDRLLEPIAARDDCADGAKSLTGGDGRRSWSRRWRECTDSARHRPAHQARGTQLWRTS